tara:strand:- start:36 stop:227 length:192 start_codon:yes stop_codon:yes gene_type:complete
MLERKDLKVGSVFYVNKEGAIDLKGLKVTLTDEYEREFNGVTFKVFIGDTIRGRWTTRAIIKD